MRTLTDRFQECRTDLEIQIRGRPVVQAVRRVREQLDVIQREGLRSMSDAQTRIANPLLGVLNQGLDHFEAVEFVPPASHPPAQVVNEAPMLLRGLGRVLVSGLLVVCTVSLLLEIGGFLAWTTLTTFALFVGLEVWVNVDRSRRQSMREAAARAVQAERGNGHGALRQQQGLKSVERCLHLIDNAIPDDEEQQSPPPLCGPNPPVKPPESESTRRR